ncbi:MAG: substrate-binding domain-containing protein [Elusimicrobia bacterium]|nr:substrate-binding domain-containing protein [Elusimicrobiota bacterium]
MPLALVLFWLSASPARAGGEHIVLVSHGGVGNPFWGVLFNGAKQAASDVGARLQILFPNQDGDQPGTTQKLAEAISTQPDGIAVTLATPAHCEYIREARDKGIPVVVYNARAVAAGAKCPYQAYIGMDEYEAGRASARRAWASGRVKGRAVVGLTEAGHVGLQARAKGIGDVLRGHKVVVEVMDLGNDASAIGTRFRGYLERHKADLTALFIPSPQGAHPILRLMQDDPSGAGKKYAATFDLTPLILKGIDQGFIDHTVDQQPYLQGYYAVLQLAMAARGKFAPSDIDTGVGVVQRETAKAVAELVQKGVR